MIFRASIGPADAVVEPIAPLLIISDVRRPLAAYTLIATGEHVIKIRAFHGREGVRLVRAAIAVVVYDSDFLVCRPFGGEIDV